MYMGAFISAQWFEQAKIIADAAVVVVAPQALEIFLLLRVVDDIFVKASYSQQTCSYSFIKMKSRKILGQW